MTKNNTGKWIQFCIYAAFVVVCAVAFFHLWNYYLPHNKLNGNYFAVGMLTFQLLDHVKSIITGKKVVWND